MVATSRSCMLHLDEVLWQDDLALFRSIDGRVPWASRFGQGQVKVLQFNARTQAATYVLNWPANYDPLGEHAHGGNCSELILAGSILEGETVWEAGSFFYLEVGERHGPFRAGPEGCTLLVHVDGPLFDKQFVDTLMEQGKAARFHA